MSGNLVRQIFVGELESKWLPLDGEGCVIKKAENIKEVCPNLTKRTIFGALALRMQIMSLGR